MTRILSYNILVGGTRRVDQIASMIASAQPDVVGLVEATNPGVVEELARRLDMQPVLSDSAKHIQDWQVAVLTRLPIIQTTVHSHLDITKPVLEVCVEEASGRELTIFLTHLSAAFSEERAGDAIRRTEVRELLRLLAQRHGTPRLLMGDFNALALGCLLVQLGLAVYLAVRARDRAVSLVLLAGVLLGLVAGVAIYRNCWSFGRVLVWLPLGLGVWGLEERRGWILLLLTPCALGTWAAIRGII